MPTETPLPTPPPTPLPASVYVEGVALKKVIGDRLLPVIYGYTYDNRLYRSRDNGRVWDFVSAAPAVDDFIMSPANPFVLYSGAALDCSAEGAETQPLYVSTDGGVTFIDLKPILALRPLLAHPTDPETLLAAACDGIYLTEDGGQTWQMRSDSSESALWRDYVAVEMVAAYLAGAPEPEAPNWDHLYVLAQNADGASVVAYSGSEGDDWGQITPADAKNPFKISSLAADPAIAGRLWLAESEGVWATENLGQFWGFTGRGLEGVLEMGLNDLVQQPDNRLFVGTKMGLFTKLADEAEWAALSGEPFSQLDVQGLLFTDSAPDHLWLNTNDGVYTYGDEE